MQRTYSGCSFQELRSHSMAALNAILKSDKPVNASERESSRMEFTVDWICPVFFLGE